MCDDLNCHVPEALHLAEPFVFDFFVLGPQQILQLPKNVLVLCFGCFLIRQSEVPSAKDLVTIEIGRVVDGLNEGRSIRAQETYRYDDE